MPISHVGYVMKYFMQYRSEVAYVIDQPVEHRTKLLTSGDCPDLQYLISLVDLLATCAEVWQLYDLMCGVNVLMYVSNHEFFFWTGTWIINKFPWQYRC